MTITQKRKKERKDLWQKKLSFVTNWPKNCHLQQIKKKSYCLSQIDQRTIICHKSTNDESALVAMMCVKKMRNPDQIEGNKASQTNMLTLSIDTMLYIYLLTVSTLWTSKTMGANLNKSKTLSPKKPCCTSTYLQCPHSQHQNRGCQSKQSKALSPKKPCCTSTYLQCPHFQRQNNLGANLNKF